MVIQVRGCGSHQDGSNVMGRSGWILDVFRGNMGIMETIIL